MRLPIWMQWKPKLPMKSKFPNFDSFFPELLENHFCNRRLLEKVRGMLETKEQLRQNEIQFKEQCRQELARLQKNLQ